MTGTNGDDFALPQDGDDAVIRVFNTDDVLSFYANAYLDGAAFLVRFSDMPERQAAGIMGVLMEIMESEQWANVALDRVRTLSELIGDNGGVKE